MDESAPLVSVVTPVYNGERYLDECIRSVRSQSYENWEYVIVDNCSTDGTAEIARRHAAEDARIRVVSNERFLSLIDNWNAALGHIPDDAAYCKVVHADDMLFPECLEEMTRVARENPRVGVVGAYLMRGDELRGEGFPFPDEFRDGRQVCRETLLKKYYVFGSPTSTLLRADLLRARPQAYNPDNLHADVELCFELLQEADFGFVHQVLTYTRTHEDSQTSTVADVYDTNLVENNLAMLFKYGPRVFSEAEFADLKDAAMDRYYRRMSFRVGRLLDRRYRGYQEKVLGDLGLRLDVAKLARAVASRWSNVLLNPKTATERMIRRIAGRS